MSHSMSFAADAASKTFQELLIDNTYILVK